MQLRNALPSDASRSGYEVGRRLSFVFVVFFFNFEFFFSLANRVEQPTPFDLLAVFCFVVFFSRPLRVALGAVSSSIGFDLTSSFWW